MQSYTVYVFLNQATEPSSCTNKTQWQMYGAAACRLNNVYRYFPAVSRWGLFAAISIDIQTSKQPVRPLLVQVVRDPGRQMRNGQVCK